MKRLRFLALQSTLLSCLSFLYLGIHFKSTSNDSVNEMAEQVTSIDYLNTLSFLANTADRVDECNLPKDVSPLIVGTQWIHSTTRWHRIRSQINEIYPFPSSSLSPAKSSDTVVNSLHSKNGPQYTKIVDNYRKHRPVYSYQIIPNYFEVGNPAVDTAASTRCQARQERERGGDGGNVVQQQGLFQIGLSTHISAEHAKFETIKNLAKWWRGPISVAVYVPGPEFLGQLDSLLDTVFKSPLNQRIRPEEQDRHNEYGNEEFNEEEEALQNNGGAWDYSSTITFHLVFGREFDEHDTDVQRNPYDFLYPINTLRNIAAQYCNGCDMVLVSDSNFIPSIDMYTTLRYDSRLQQEMKSAAKAKPSLFVIPEFKYSESASASSKKLSSLSAAIDVDSLLENCRSGNIMPVGAKFALSSSSLAKGGGSGGRSKKHVGSGGGGDAAKLGSNDAGIQQTSLRKWCAGEHSETEAYRLSKSNDPINFLKWHHLTSQKLQLQHESPISQSPPLLYSLYLDYQKTKNFEPSWLAFKSQVPPFNEKFLGGPFSKRAPILEVTSEGYQIHVIPSMFLLEKSDSVDDEVSGTTSSKKHLGFMQENDVNLKMEINKDVLEATIGYMQAQVRSKSNKLKEMTRMLFWNEQFQ